MRDGARGAAVAGCRCREGWNGDPVPEGSGEGWNGVLGSEGSGEGWSRGSVPEWSRDGCGWSRCRRGPHGAALAGSRCWRNGRSGVRPLSGIEVTAGLGEETSCGAWRCGAMTHKPPRSPLRAPSLPRPVPPCLGRWLRENGVLRADGREMTLERGG